MFCKKASCTGWLNCLSHVIQSCGSTHRRLRVRRHDRVADFVSSELEVKGYEVTREPRIAFEGTCRKSDIVATKGDVSHCIDVHICEDACRMFKRPIHSIRGESEVKVLQAGDSMRDKGAHESLAD